MKKTRRFIAVLLMIISLVASSLIVYAAPNCIHCNKTTVLYSSQYLYREKVGEHLVTFSNGTQAICFTYNDYYRNTYYCSNCNSYPWEDSVVTVHSIAH